MKTPSLTSVHKRHGDSASGFDQQHIFRTGRIIDARTLTSSRDGHVLLRIGNTEVEAATNIALPRDKQLQFKVIQVQPRIVLQYILPNDASASTNPLKAAMVSMLPQQGGLAPLLTALSTYSFAEKTDGMQIPGPIADAFINAIPERKDVLKADGLKQAILQSGLFLEAKLAASASHSTAEISDDMKVLLLRLIRVLAKVSSGGVPGTSGSPGDEMLQCNDDLPLPHRQQFVGQQRISLTASTGMDTTADISMLLKKAHAALARMVLHQIATTENIEQGHEVLRLELPVRQQNNVDIVSISIEHEQKGHDPQDNRPWIIDLTIKLPTLGTLNIRTSLHKQGISSTFWCERKDAQAMIERRLEQLKSKLAEHGMKTLSLSCRSGPFPACTNTTDNAALIDQHV